MLRRPQCSPAGECRGLQGTAGEGRIGLSLAISHFCDATQREGEAYICQNLNYSMWKDLPSGSEHQAAEDLV